MSEIDRFLTANSEYVAGFPGARPKEPKLRVAVLACMDSRLALFGALGLETGQRVLDVACGIGRHSLPLASRGYDVTGLDYTSAYLVRAQSGADGLPVRFLRGDMRRLPFSTARFDAAWP